MAILIDMSSVLHRKIHSSLKAVKDIRIENGEYVTKDYIHMVIQNIIKDIVQNHHQYSKKYGDIVLLFDDSSYWRKDVYPDYKSHRKVNRDKNPVNYKEVYVYYNELAEILAEHFPWKVLKVNNAEADDLILILARELSQSEEVLILSPDKDMIQAQKYPNIKQYSPLTNKWMVPENKNESMDDWLKEHVCLGDGSDDVPKIVDHVEFTPIFIEHLKANGYSETNPLDFVGRHHTLSELKKTFNVYKTNRSGEDTHEKDIYVDVKFGPAGLKKSIEKHGSLDAFLDSHPLYRIHYERNRRLVLEEGIPQNISVLCMMEYRSAKCSTNSQKIQEYLEKHSLFELAMDLTFLTGSEVKSTLEEDALAWEL